MEAQHIAPFEEAPEGLDEARLIEETGPARRIAELVASPLRAVGYRLVRVRLSSAAEPILQVMAEKPDGTMSVEDCEAASDAISPHLDLEDPITAPYRLEVSSPGIDRPLVRESDFRRAIGHETRVELSRPLEGRKRFRGEIEAVETVEGKVVVDIRLPVEGETEEVVARLVVEDIAEARLVMTEDLIRDSLKREKAEIKQAKIDARKARAERLEQRKKQIKRPDEAPASEPKET